MILDLESFIKRERPFWDELEKLLERQSFVTRGDSEESLSRIRRFHYLYKRTSADLAKLQTFASEPELRQYLEDLIAQAYIRLHGKAETSGKFRPLHWILRVYPRAFRRHAGAFWLAFWVSMIGALFGGFVISQAADNKVRLLPQQFGHLVQSPSERVQAEEANALEPEQNQSRAPFSAHLMNNNIRVAINAMAFGILFGIFTIVLLFYNGIILGLICYEYVADGQAEFLAGWLLPHGVPELTAIFMGGQCGLILARAVIGWGTNLTIRERFRAIRDDLVVLVIGFCVLLVWAGIIESYLSQTHEPAIPYSLKIGFGIVELVVMSAYLYLSGRGEDSPDEEVINNLPGFRRSPAAAGLQSR
ncbi:MAG: putative membrane protein SpoIIM required for sporulation [Verrucomicrobiales bacterium]